MGLVNSWASDVYNMHGIEIAKTVETLRDWGVDGWQNIVVKSTIGYHPWCCDDGEITQQNIQQKVADLKILYEANKKYIVAIGECGIDTYYPGSEQTLSLQKQLFILQCNLAQELKLPLMIHIRKDFETAFDVLQNYRDLTMYIHCRGFGPEEIRRLQDLNSKKLFIGFCGNVTYKNAQNLRDSLAKISLDQLLLETDAPWLSPQIVRGTTNHPANVWYLYQFVAEFLNITPELLSDQIEQNFTTLYTL